MGTANNITSTASDRFTTSLIISEEEGMRHDHVLNIIRRMQGRGAIQPTETYREVKGVSLPMFMLDIDEAREVLLRIRKPKGLTIDAGHRFGRWLVTDPTPIRNGKRIDVVCLCDCGTVRNVSKARLLRGTSLSCGCLARELSAKRATKHGGAYSSEYGIWSKIIARCENPNHPAYPNYGARGVSVCQEWKESFQSFIQDMGPRPSPEHSVDRFPDNSGNYEPSNCRWATWVEQNNNKSNNHLVEFNGETKTIAQWAQEFGMSHGTLSQRLMRGWDVVDALTIPVNGISDLRNGGYANMKRVKFND
jgi:hypothetical protein